METIEKIKVELDALAGKISGDDRLHAAVDLGVHIETINRYLRGEVKKESFGLDLLSYLKKRVAEREKALTE